MKYSLIIIIWLGFIFSGCTQNITSQAIISQEVNVQKPPLIIVGEGGPSGSLFERAADTYEQEKKGERYTVHSGDDFIAAMRDYVEKHGPIQHLEYFGHGNSVGLYINQAPHINGALYANDPRVDQDYIAASIYELPRETFMPGGSVRFNGCNVAEGHLEGKNNLAQNFANYFGITADAPLGPTEFSQVPDTIKPYHNSNALGKEFRGPVYLVPTDPERGFVLISPQIAIEGYADVYENTRVAHSIKMLEKKGWTPEKMGWTPALELWKNTTYSELFSLCQIVALEHPACSEVQKYPPNDMVRNLVVLSTLMDATSLPITTKRTNPWYQKYISYGMEYALLTDDFIHKKWYTRGELLELAGNIQTFKETL